ncbi:MAG: FAD-dependent oxidoreductase [Thermoguttaceae bacterium]|jgi:phytoene dehydrogenase-like protein|nr:FAD-dependent oxidoreductase [Thermoguttaceae bacterium]
MAHDVLDGVRERYDVVVIGGGLGGMTAANTLARAGHAVLLLEQHTKLGGLATWFRRRGGHIFDVALHGFPVGMIKSCRRYWTRELADAIVQLKRIRFDNPMFSLTTTFDRQDFTRLLIDGFGIPHDAVHGFFDTARDMQFTDQPDLTTGQLFDRFFPGRDDVVRLLMEPITYANGSTLEDPALTYGIVFSNFMSKGVYTFKGGTDRLVKLMLEEIRRNGVDVRVGVKAERIEVGAGRRVAGVCAGGRRIAAPAVVSNGNLLGTIFDLVDEAAWPADFLEQARAVRLNNSSTQVYLALRDGEEIDEATGDLLFSSVAPSFQTDLLLSRDITSRTYSFYYPKARPQEKPHYLVVASSNARYDDWANLAPEEYEAGKRRLIDDAVRDLDRYVPGIRDKLDWTEAATPRTFRRYTGHWQGASFGTKFEGLAVSRSLPEQIAGLYHAGSVGIIMSGWLGAVNYGVIVANDVDAYLLNNASRASAPAPELP